MIVKSITLYKASQASRRAQTRQNMITMKVISIVALHRNNGIRSKAVGMGWAGVATCSAFFRVSKGVSVVWAGCTALENFRVSIAYLTGSKVELCTL